jgi:hypothetical protein
MFKYHDIGWNVYVIPSTASLISTAGVGGSDDWNATKQNAAFIGTGFSWTEPSSCPGTCYPNTNITSTGSRPPSRTGASEVPGTIPQSGLSAEGTGYFHQQFHDNLVWGDATQTPVYYHADPFYDDIKFYNNVVRNIYGYCMADVSGVKAGPEPVGNVQFYNNTCYNTLWGIYEANETNLVPWANGLFRNNIVLGDTWSNYSFNYYYSGDHTTGSSNLFFGNTSVQNQVSSPATRLTNNIFLNPGLVNPGVFDFRVASITSAAYGNGVPVPLGTDHDGNPRPLGNRYDVGAYQFTDGQTLPVQCDLNADGVVNSLDIQVAVGQATGMVPCSTADLMQTGQCNVVDVQRVITAASGGTCRIGN